MGAVMGMACVDGVITMEVVLSAFSARKCLVEPQIRLKPSSVNQNQMAIFTSMLFRCTCSRKDERQAQEAQARLSQGPCTSAQTAELRGRAGWALTVFFARTSDGSSKTEAVSKLSPPTPRLTLWRLSLSCSRVCGTFLLRACFEVFQPGQMPTLPLRDASWPVPSGVGTNPL